MTSSYPRGWRILLTRRWLGYLALTLVFAFACVCLGVWQFARLDEARVEKARIEANYDAEPRNVESVLPTGEPFDLENKWLPVSAKGEYLTNDQLLVRSRPLQGEIGFEVLSPLLLPDGRVFIVNRGWIPSGETTAIPSDVPLPPRGTVDVVARLKPSEPALLGRTADADTVPTIELDLIESLLGRDVISGAYGVLVSESPAAPDLPMPATKPELTEGPHLSYALQWLLFAIMGFIGLSLAVRNERRIKLGLGQGDKRFARRRPTDESEEDRIIELGKPL